MIFSFDALWQYQATACVLPADIRHAVVPVVGWLGPVAAPFGIKGAGLASPLTPGQAWPLGTGLWLRRTLTVDGKADVMLRGQIDNACLIYLDGVFVGAVNPTNAAVDDISTFTVVLPQSLLPAGNHQLAVLALDEGAMGYGDSTWFWLEADYIPLVQTLWPGPPLNESVEWLNDVTIYEDGAEDREQLRDIPRHQYRMTSFVPHGSRQRVRNDLFGGRAKRWLVPVWSQIQQLGALAADSLTIAPVTSFSDYTNHGALILWQSPERWQVVGIDTVGGANLINLTSPTQAFDDAWVAPLKRGHFLGDPQRSFDGRSSRVTFTFEIEDNQVLAPGAPAQYLGNDIYFEPGLLDGDKLDENITSVINMVDEDLGPVSYSSPWLHNRPSRSHRMMGETPEEAWGIRNWLHRRAGRFKPFWQPSFEQDMRVLNTGLIAATLTISPDHFMRFALDRNHIAIESTTGWTAHAITAAVATDATHTDLTLNPPLNKQASTIKRVSFLGLRRLNADRVEIAWIGGPVCSCSVPVLDITP